MKYTIEGLQQERLFKWGLDASDAVILRFLIDFYNTDEMKKLIIDEKVFFWVHYETVLREIPILNIKKAALANRFKRYIDCNLMESYLDKSKGGTYTYYRFIENRFKKLLTYTDSNIDSTQSQIGVPTQSQIGTIYSNTNKNNKSLSKDKDKSSNKLLKNKFLLSLLEEFNKSSYTPNFKTDKLYKYHTKLLKYIRALKAGQFSRVVDLDHNFLEKNYITPKHLNMKWTEAEIMEGVKDLKLMFKEGYWPEDKTNLVKTNIANLFYNPGRFNRKSESNGGTSFFLMAAIKGAKRLRKEASMKETDAYKKAKTRKRRPKNNPGPKADDVISMKEWQREQDEKRNRVNDRKRGTK